MSPEIPGRQLRQWLSRAHNRHVAGPIDHAAVVSHVREDGQFRGRYTFLALMACDIATTTPWTACSPSPPPDADTRGSRLVQTTSKTRRSG